MIFQDPLSSLNPIMKVGKQITEAMIINSNKLKKLYQDLISDKLVKYNNEKALKRRTIEQAKDDTINNDSLREDILPFSNCLAAS